MEHRLFGTRNNHRLKYPRGKSPQGKYAKNLGEKIGSGGETKYWKIELEYVRRDIIWSKRKKV